jgi:hypothetical protein
MTGKKSKKSSNGDCLLYRILASRALTFSSPQYWAQSWHLIQIGAIKASLGA